jgi:hypothetical protein
MICGTPVGRESAWKTNWRNIAHARQGVTVFGVSERYRDYISYHPVN